MKSSTFWIVLVALSFTMGCSGILSSDDNNVGTAGGALESGADCEEQCKAQFHECRESPERGGGPGASGCAHAKNDCEASC